MGAAIKWAWCFPVLVLYRHGSTLGHCAYNFGPVIFMDRQCKDSTDLIAHELVHTKQLIATHGLHAILYYASRRYRYWAESQAYRASIRAGLAPEIAAQLMAHGYEFDETPETILHHLTRKD